MEIKTKKMVTFSFHSEIDNKELFGGFFVGGKEVLSLGDILISLSLSELKTLRLRIDGQIAQLEGEKNEL